MTSREYLNLDNVCWECDYPHSDSTWPRSPELFQEHVVGVPDADVEKMAHQNAMRLFNYDPFTPMGGKENCTVGTLRARAEGHDISLHYGKKSGHAGTLSADLVSASASKSS